MKAIKLYEKEFQICLIVWEQEPVSLNELTHLCMESLGWERSTTYTMIQRLVNKGIIQRNGTMVTAVLSKERVQDERTVELIQNTFEGKLSELFRALSRIVSMHFDTFDRI